MECEIDGKIAGADRQVVVVIEQAARRQVDRLIAGELRRWIDGRIDEFGLIDCQERIDIIIGISALEVG